MPSLIRECNQPWWAWGRVNTSWLRQEATCPHLLGLPRALLRALEDYLRAKVGHPEHAHQPAQAGVWGSLRGHASS